MSGKTYTYLSMKQKDVNLPSKHHHMGVPVTALALSDAMRSRGPSLIITCDSNKKYFLNKIILFYMISTL